MTTIDINGLTEEELHDLHHRIVERLRVLHQMRMQASMLRFNVGERVCFMTNDNRLLFGVITRYNRKTVTVQTDSSGQWRVAPSLLERLPPKERKPAESRAALEGWQPPPKG